MKKYSNLKASVAPMVLGIALVSAPAYAQDDESEADAVIVVTGSRITNPNLELSSPVGVVTSEELELKQTNTAEQFLRELPSAVPSIGSAVNNGNGGASFVNLRGVGSVRNLVLLDGRRFTPADTTGRVDLNNIPLAVIERTDILTGGATTTYGADAIGGVVNFITKKDFSGLEATASQQITEEGDGNIFRAEVTIGANFDDGRGNAVFSVGYQEADPVFQGDRSFSIDNISAFTGNAGGSSAAVPALIIGPGTFGQINAAGTDIVPGVFDRPYNFNPTNIFQTPFERFNMYGAARYEVSDAVEVFTQGVFSKNTVSTIIAPGGSFFNTYRFNLNNPTIPEAIAARFGAGLGLTAAQYAAARNTQFGPTLADGSPNPDYVEFSSQVRRRSVEAGTRDSNFTTTMFHIVAGARGAITDTINWEVSGSYGESENVQRQTGFARLSTLGPALRALPNGQCIAPAPAGCVPVNLFGTAGSITPEMIAYAFSAEQFVFNNASLAQAQALITGDLGWGISETPISFAVGAEFREFKATQRSDDASKTPGEVIGGGGAAPDINGKYNVRDVFGEVAIPIFEGQPFAESLTLELGGRYSDYSTAGTNFTWKAGGSWEPVVGLSIRGNYQRSSRAPNIGELFTPVTTGLSNLTADPCQGAAPRTNAALAAVCIAQGAPAAIVNAGGILPPAAGQINITTGGNPNLGVEKATTWTVGFVAEPMSNLSISLDYFNIKVTDAISSATVGDVIGGCFNSGNLNFAANPLCQLIERSSFTGGLDGSPNEVRGLLLFQSNLGRIATDGVDLSIRYKTDLTENIVLNYGFDGTWTNKNTFQAFPGAINRDCIGFYSVNCGSIQPKIAFNQRLSGTFNEEFTLSLAHRYIDGVEYEPLQLIDDIAAGGGPLAQFLTIPAEHYFDLAGRWEITDNVTVTMTVSNLLNNKPKLVGSDVGSTAFNSGNVYPSTYDALGRRYAASVKFKF